MNKYLTIVIPAYNMQDYLERCLDSLIVPQPMLDKLEVLIINDGSKDNSSKIAHDYENRFPNVFRVIDKDNGNYGSCINYGLKEAKGKYIKILDADDWFDTNGLMELISNLSSLKEDVDLILTDYKLVDETGKELSIGQQKNIASGEIFDFNSKQVIYYPMYMITYRVDLLRNIGYRQTEGIFYTDAEWANCPLYNVKRCVYYPCLVYTYLKGRVGQSTDFSVIVNRIWQLKTVLKSLVEYRKHIDVSRYPMADDHNTHAIYILAINIFNILLVKTTPSADDLNSLDELDLYLKNNCPEIWNESGRAIVKKWLPIKYVAYWRKKRKIHPLVTIINKYLR